MGDWQGGNIVDRGDPPANLEPLADLSARCLKWWNECVARHAQRHGARARTDLGAPPSLEGDEETALEVDPELEPEHILVVSHGGLIGTLVKGLLGSRKVCAAEGVVVGRCFNASISVVAKRNASSAEPRDTLSLSPSKPAQPNAHDGNL